MKWIGISGSRQTNQKVEDDVRREVDMILKRGDGVVVGGAMGVDYFAADEMLRQGLAKERLKVCLPVTFDLYAKHYRKRAEEGVVTSAEAETLIEQLQNVKNSGVECLVENMLNTEVNKDTYFGRNGKIVELSDELVAFQVNDSAGTQNTIDQAKAKGIKVTQYLYKI